MATATETQNPSQSPPEITFLSRVASIPMVSSSLESIIDTLSRNPYTRASYSTAKDLSSTAYKYTEPLQVRLAPLIVRADDIANMAVDVVESRYPYPFKAKPEEVASYVRGRRESATQYMNERVSEANKAIDEKVRSPAYNVAQGIDQRFAPIVDYFEVTVARLGTSEAGPSTQPADTKYQYQRALALSKTLKDNLYVYSNDQLKQVQAQSVLVQKATETAQSISTAATSSISSAQARIYELSDKMLCELQKLQASTASLSASLQTSAANTIHNSTSQIQAQIPTHIQERYIELSNHLSSAIAELASIITAKDLPMQEKVGRVSNEVRERVSPILDGVKKSVQDILSRGKPVSPEQSPKPVNGTNGVNGSNGHISETD